MAYNSDTLPWTWNAPEYDGDSPVTGYYVERYVDSSWDIVNETPTGADSLSNELSEAASSDNPCRIRAVNKSGVGPPSASVTLRGVSVFVCLTRMWTDAQRYGRPAECRWRPLRKFHNSIP